MIYSTSSLTTGVDTVTGGAGDDSITADNTGTDVTSTADRVDGGDGTDTISFFSDGAAPALPKLSNVEVAYIYDQDADLDLSVSSVSSLEQVHLVRSDGAFGLSLGANATTAAANDIVLTGAGADAGITITYGAAVTAGTLLVNGVTTAGAEADEDLNMAGTKLATANINAVTTKSSIDNVSVGAATAINLDAAVDFTAGALATTGSKATLTVSGAGKVTLGQIDNDITSIVATDNTGGLVVTAPADSKDGIYTLSAGADKFTTDDDGFATADKFAVDAGDGTDTLVIAADDDVSTTDEGGRYTNFETLQRSIDANLDVSVFGADTTITSAVLADGGLTNMQAALAEGITLAADNAGSTFTLKTATGKTDTLSVVSKNSTATASADLTTATIDGFEILNFTASSGSTGDVTAVSITTADQLKTVNLSGASAVAIDVANDTAALTALNASANTAGTSITVGAQTGDLVVTGSEKVDAITLEAAGSGGTQTINAGAGKDVITSTIAISNAATIDGGADEDTLSFSDANATTETLTIGDNSFAKLTSVEVIDFSGAIAGDLFWTLGGFANALATSVGGTLKVTGDTFATGAADDDITINASVLTAGNSINVNVKNTDATAGGVANIAITGSDGDDTVAVEEVTAESANVITITAGKGDDSITVKTSDSQDGGIIVNAGAGDDTIVLTDATTDAAGTVNLVTPGAGNDTIKLDSEGANTVFTIVTGATAAANGVDTITAFTQGASSDVLKIDAFLDATAMNAKLGANPGGASDVSGDVQLLVDIAGGEDITTAEGLTAALAAGGEYSNVDMGASAKAVFVTAASSEASVAQNVFFATSDAAGNVSVSLVGTITGDIDSFDADNFNIA